MSFISTPDTSDRTPITPYLAVGSVAGAIIALQIAIMCIFQTGSSAP